MLALHSPALPFFLASRTHLLTPLAAAPTLFLTVYNTCEHQENPAGRPVLLAPSASRLSLEPQLLRRSSARLIPNFPRFIASGHLCSRQHRHRYRQQRSGTLYSRARASRCIGERDRVPFESRPAAGGCGSPPSTGQSVITACPIVSAKFTDSLGRGSGFSPLHRAYCLWMSPALSPS